MAEEEVREPIEADRVRASVEEWLEKAGYNTFQAEALVDAGVDWHAAVELLKAGCDPDTAVDILL